MTGGYDRETLQDLADLPLPTHPIAYRGGIAFCTGRVEGIAEGTLMTAREARRLAARLLLAADDHDAIVDQATASAPVRRVAPPRDG